MGLRAPSRTTLRDRSPEELLALLQGGPARWNTPGVIGRAQRLQAQSALDGFHAALSGTAHAYELHLKTAASTGGEQLPVARDDTVERVADGIGHLLGVPERRAPKAGVTSGIGLEVPIGPQGQEDPSKSFLVALR